MLAKGERERTEPVKTARKIFTAILKICRQGETLYNDALRPSIFNCMVRVACVMLVEFIHFMQKSSA